MSESQPILETDPRFPSGPWTGFFLQKAFPGRHLMEMHLAFSKGALKGEGRDQIGRFTLNGGYNLQDGKCHWTKHYLGQHDVFYKGFNEGKGIWGVWEINNPDFHDQGGFHIWPEGLAIDEDDKLTEKALLSDEIDETFETSEPLATPLR